jgi:hypothetical protein
MDPPSTDIAGRIMHGAMINPTPRDGSTQGYDSAMYGQYGPSFDPGLNAARPNGQALSAGNPLIVSSGSSLVSTISHPNPGERPQLITAAILTVVNAPAPIGSFRPSYSGADKTAPANVSQINPAYLASLPPVSSTPTMAIVEGYFERPWIDHVPNWMGRYIHPSENMPDYGREMASRVGEGALMLHLDYPLAEKETLLIRFLQLGIDWYGVVEDGGENNWPPNGGHESGRKWPIVFAGLMLGIHGMRDIGPGDGSGAVWFGEDAQTFYVSQSDIDMTHSPDLRGCYLEEYEHSDLGLPEWGIRHGTHPSADNKAWCAVYRNCCTGNSWPGFVLAAHIMGAQDTWDHDPLFDYQDRYMEIQEVGTWTRSWSDFSEEMWDTYRSEVGDPALVLQAAPMNQTLRLDWFVNGTLPLTSTWQIAYEGPLGLPPSPVVGISNPTRAYTFTSLTNYVPYTVTLNAMGAATPILTDTVVVWPTDLFSFMPFIAEN